MVLAFLALSLVGSSTESFMVDGVRRSALIFTPMSTEVPAPLVFCFHGHGGGSRNSAMKFDIHSEWKEAIVVYPQGLPSTGRLDPEGRKPGWQKGAGDQGDRDLKFFDAMLTWVKKTYKVDPKRIYAMGHSNGGSFTYTLWASRGDVFAAVAPSAALFGIGGRLAKPLPVLMIGGTKDTIVPFENQKLNMERVKQLNQCSGTGTDLGNGVMAWKGETDVWTYIYAGTHTFPDEGGKVIVKFFKSHPKP